VLVFTNDLCLCTAFYRRTNELKSGIDIPEEVIKEFDIFWEKHRATPLEGA
jgi:DNA helicase MCM9